MNRQRRRSGGRVQWEPLAQRQWIPTGHTRPTSTDESPASAVGEAAVAADGGGAAHAAHVKMVPTHGEMVQCSLSDRDESNDDTRSVKSAVAVTTFRVGDSVIGESEHDLEGGEGGGEAAVAADDAQPNKETRSTRQPRDITPNEQHVVLKWAGRNDAKHVGNMWVVVWGIGASGQHM